jgi:hypothetical protein
MPVIEVVEIFLLKDSGGRAVDYPEVVHALSESIPEKAKHDNHKHHI